MPKPRFCSPKNDGDQTMDGFDQVWVSANQPVEVGWNQKESDSQVGAKASAQYDVPSSVELKDIQIQIKEKVADSRRPIEKLKNRQLPILWDKPMPTNGAHWLPSHDPQMTLIETASEGLSYVIPSSTLNKGPDVDPLANSKPKEKIDHIKVGDKG